MLILYKINHNYILFIYYLFSVLYVNNILILSFILELCKFLFQIINIGCKYFIIYNYFILKYQPTTFTEFIPNYNSLYESQIYELNKQLNDEKNKNTLLNNQIISYI